MWKKNKLGTNDQNISDQIQHNLEYRKGIKFRAAAKLGKYKYFSTVRVYCEDKLEIYTWYSQNLFDCLFVMQFNRAFFRKSCKKVEAVITLELIDWVNLDKSDANSTYVSFLNKFREMYKKTFLSKPFNLSIGVKNHVVTLGSRKAFWNP